VFKDLLDGGVDDNTGIPAILEVVQHLKDLREAQEDRLARVQSKDQAARILALLSQRGIILVEIDSGAKPSLQSVAEVLTPKQALDNAAYARARLANLSCAVGMPESNKPRGTWTRRAQVFTTKGGRH
jgi:NADPH-dependent ferric siderophore reductase